MAQQSILGRIAQLARANINSLIDSAEDPEKMLDQMIRDYTGNISEAEDAVAQSIGNLRMMEDDQREAERGGRRVGRQGRGGGGQGRELAAGIPAEADRFENLARVALKRQIDFESQAKDLAPTIAQQTEVVEKLKSGLNAMRGKLEELQDEARRARGARQDRRGADEGARRPQERRTSPTRPARSSRFEDKIRREEAKVAGQAELAASSLDAQFESLDDVAEDAEVEARLADLQK